MKRASLLSATLAFGTLGFVGCDDDRSDDVPPAPPPAKMNEMMHEGAIKDDPTDPVGIPATAPASPTRPADRRAADDIRRSLKEGPGSIEDAADPTEDDAADPDAAGEDTGGTDEAEGTGG